MSTFRTNHADWQAYFQAYLDASRGKADPNDLAIVMTHREEEIVRVQREKIDELIRIQGRQGNYDYKPYQFGLLIGLYIGRGIITEEPVHFPERPKSYLMNDEVLKSRILAIIDAWDEQVIAPQGFVDEIKAALNQTDEEIQCSQPQTPASRIIRESERLSPIPNVRTELPRQKLFGRIYERLSTCFL